MNRARLLTRSEGSLLFMKDDQLVRSQHISYPGYMSCIGLVRHRFMLAIVIVNQNRLN